MRHQVSFQVRSWSSLRASESQISFNHLLIWNLNLQDSGDSYCSRSSPPAVPPGGRSTALASLPPPPPPPPLPPHLPSFSPGWAPPTTRVSRWVDGWVGGIPLRDVIWSLQILLGSYFEIVPEKLHFWACFCRKCDRRSLTWQEVKAEK